MRWITNIRIKDMAILLKVSGVHIFLNSVLNNGISASGGEGEMGECGGCKFIATHHLHRISFFLAFPPLPLLLNLNISLALTHPNKQINQLFKERGGTVPVPVLLRPRPVRLV